MKTIITIIVALLLGVVAYSYINSAETISIKVVEKERVQDGESSKYLIFAEEEVFENTDSILFLKWNSSDIYRDLQPGEIYKVKVAGWRISAASSYRNIIKIEK